jgi:putative ABC transport system substrate-binding protein
VERRTFLAGTGAVLLGTPLAANSQQRGKIARVGILIFGPPETAEEQAKRAAVSPFWAAMKELGWIYGQNVIAELRYGESEEPLQRGAADLVRLNVDVVVVLTAGLAKNVQRETKTIPIVVFASGADLVAAGLVASLAKPGGNVTGMQVLNDELVGKRLELLRAIVPNLARVAWLRDDVNWSVVPEVGTRYDQLAVSAAQALGIVLHPIVLHQAGEFDAAFLGMMKNRDQGLVVVASALMRLHRKAVIELAAKHRIIAIYEDPVDVKLGGLMSYGANPPELFRRATSYIDKILRGSKPADLPIQQPTKFDLVINLKTAKALGLTIPQSLLGRADEVIQ